VAAVIGAQRAASGTSDPHLATAVVGGVAAAAGRLVIVLFLVAGVLTSGGQGGVVNVYAGAVFLSVLGALGGAFAALTASGLLAWVAAVSERHRGFSVIVLLLVASCCR